MRVPAGVAVGGLAHYLAVGLNSGMEPARLASMTCALTGAGCSAEAAFPGQNVANAVAASQQPDGGWSDVEESLWCLGCLRALTPTDCGPIDAGLQWVASQRSADGGWGRTSRDQARIPITGLACALCPEVVGEKDLEWMERAWEADLNGPVQLTYKAGFFLMGCAHPLSRADTSLVSKTVDYLRAEQNDDGGFGPWKDHPCGSDPWSTGVVLWGLSSVPAQAPLKVVRRAVAWLEGAELPNGLWPYHPIDEGSSLALIGLSKALPLLD